MWSGILDEDKDIDYSTVGNGMHQYYDDIMGTVASEEIVQDSSHEQSESA